MLKRSLATLAILTLAACVGYSDYDEGIGEMPPLQSLRQLEGVYSNLPIDNGHYWTQGPHAQRLATAFTDFTAPWGHEHLAPATMVAITYVNEQQLAIHAMDASGRALAQRYYQQPNDFTFADGALQNRPYTRGSVGIAEIAKTSTRSMALNREGNLVIKQKVTKKGFMLGAPSLNQTNTYTEYKRLR